MRSETTGNVQRAVVFAAGAALAAVLVTCVPCQGQELQVTPELERAVSRGLEYLARTQKPDGSWQGQYGDYAGIVGIAMMTFLAHGELPDEGRYGTVIRKAVDYIIKSQQPNGLLGRDGSMYSHGFATLALGEVYGLIDDDRVGPALKKASGLIVSSQNRMGGWRYNVGSTDSDTTVSGAQMMALRAAASAGMEVPMDTIRRGVAYYRTCFCPGGGFGYTGQDGASPGRAGIGLLIMSLSGEYRSAEAKATADWLLARGASVDDGYFYYASYYISQGMFQAGGKYWRNWNATMTPQLVRMQQEDGSWPRRDSCGETGGTAFALLCIEINYNFLPIYQR